MCLADLVWQFLTQQAVHKCTGHGKYQIHDEYGGAAAQQDEHRGRAGTCQGPAHPEYKASHEVAENAFLLVLDDDLFSLNITNLPPPDKLHNHDPGYHGAADDPEHVETLKAEHFKDPEPTYGFTLIKDESQQDTHHYIS